MDFTPTIKSINIVIILIKYSDDINIDHGGRLGGREVDLEVEVAHGGRGRTWRSMVGRSFFTNFYYNSLYSYFKPITGLTIVLHNIQRINSLSINDHY